MLLLGLEGIGEGIFEILAYLSWARFGVGIGFLLNWENTHYLKVIFLLLVVNLSQPDFYIVIMNSQDIKPKSAIWEMSLVILLPNNHCLTKVAILKRKYTIFFTSLVKNSSIPNKEIGEKLPSHSCRLAS